MSLEVLTAVAEYQLASPAPPAGDALLLRQSLPPLVDLRLLN